MIEIKFEDYVRNVRANSQTAAVLAARLEKVAPGDLTAEQRKALRGVVAAALALQAVQSERDRLAPHKLRPLVDAFTNHWNAFYQSLSALGRVDESVSKNGPEAAALATSLFPDGIAFTQLPAERAWAEAQRRLNRITTEELEPVLTRLIGKEFIEGARKSTDILADAIGTGEGSRPIPSSTALADANATFGRAVGTYGRLMAASVDELDFATVERFMKAMAPVDQHRAATFGSRGGEDEDLEPTPEPVAPTPVLAPAPAPVPTPAGGNS